MFHSKSSKPLGLRVSPELEVTVFPHQKDEFLMSVRDVAIGYGVSVYVVRNILFRYLSEFKKGIHYHKGFELMEAQGITNCYAPEGAQPHQTFWTKKGVIRLGFFIKSDRANLFRDWVESLVLAQLEKSHVIPIAPIKALPQKKKALHNRLTHERMVDILAEVAKIEDKYLRMSIIEKLTGKTLD